MENVQHPNGFAERRVMSRIDAALRINYQIISDDVALNDPYDPNFVLPRYFLLLAELDQFDHAVNYELEQLSEKDQQIARILSLFNQKLNLITGSLYDAIVQSMLPIPEQVNFSETGLSFFNERPIAEGTYLHVTLSHPENFFPYCSNRSGGLQSRRRKWQISDWCIFYYHASTRPCQTG